MSRTYATPSRRSRRLLHNGYYYNDYESSNNNSGDERLHDTDDNISVDSGNFALPRRSVTYEKLDVTPTTIVKKRVISASKQRTKPVRKGASTSVTAVMTGTKDLAIGRSAPSLKATTAASLMQVTKKTVRTYSQTSVKQTKNVRTAPIPIADDKVYKKISTEVQHMFGLEEDGEDERYAHLHIHAAGESTRSFRRRNRQITRPPVSTYQDSSFRSPPAPQQEKLPSSTSIYSDSEEISSSEAFTKQPQKKLPIEGRPLYKTDPRKMSMFKLFFFTVFNIIFKCTSFVASSLANCGRMFYQMVTYMLVFDTWLLRSSPSSLLTKAPANYKKALVFLKKLVTVLLSALMLVSLCYGAGCLFYNSDFSRFFIKAPPVPVVVEKPTFGDNFFKYFDNFKSSYQRLVYTGRTKLHEKSQDRGEQYDALLQAIQTLEASLNTLELTVSERNKNAERKMAAMVANHQTAVNEIASTKATMEQTINMKEKQFQKKVENRFEEELFGLNDQIAVLRTHLNALDQNTSFSLQAASQMINENDAQQKDELLKSKVSLEKTQNDLQSLNMKLQLLEQDSLSSKGSITDSPELKSFFDSHFIENFGFLLQTMGRPTGDSRIAKDKFTSYQRLSTLFTDWLNSKDFMLKEEFDHYVLRNLTEEIRSEVAIKVQQKITSSKAPPPKSVSAAPPLSSITSRILASTSPSLTEAQVKDIIRESLDVYNADRLGLPDYALESAGGHVVNTRCSETYHHKTALVRVFGIPFYFNTNTPRAVIQPSVMPGECWAFKGHVGYVVIGLSVPVYPSSVTLEHIPRSIAPFNITSAPKDFSIYGLNTPSEYEGIHLGDFTYDENSSALQNFAIENPTGKRLRFAYIEMRVTSNWGHPDFTCIYRFRVHGTKG